MTVLATSQVNVKVRLDQKRSWPEALQHAQRQLWYASENRDECGEPFFTAWLLADGDFVHLRYHEGPEFMVARAGTHVWGTWPDTLTVEDASTYLLGPVLGLVLRLLGITCLHASAIELAGQAIAVVGPPGSGKSTTAALFAKSGYRVLSDDIVALAERGGAFMAQPAYPRLNLWPESVETLFGSREELPSQTPSWDKRYLDLTLNGYKFQPSPLPLSAVYVLSDRDSDVRAPFVDALPVQIGLTKLIENTYMNYLLDRTMRARDFDVLTRIAEVVPVRSVVPHANSAYLEKLQQVILEDFHALPACH